MQKALVDIVNPRLAKYRDAPWMAMAIMVGQAGLIVGAAWFYYTYDSTVETLTMDQDTANSLTYWEATGDHIVGSSVVFGGHFLSRWWGIAYAAHPDWEYFDQDYTMQFKDAFDKDGGMGFALAIDNELTTNELIQHLPRKDLAHFFDVEASYGAVSFPCHVRAFPCNAYSPLPNGSRLMHTWAEVQRKVGLFNATEACDDKFECKSLQGLVEVVVVRHPSWTQSLINSLAMVSYTELVVTGLVMYVYMARKHGVCWCRDRSRLNEVMRLATEAKTEAEMEQLHQNA